MHFLVAAMISVTTVQSVQVAGNGCPAATEAKGTWDEGTSTLRLELPVIDAGATSTARAAKLIRKACNAVTTLRHAPGMQMSPVAARIKASASAGASTELSLRLHYQGQAATASQSETLPTPGGAPVTRTLTFAETWSPCAAETTLVATLGVVARGDNAAFRVEGSLEVELKTRPCSSATPAP